MDLGGTRLLVTGSYTLQLLRTITFAVELGYEVPHVGLTPFTVGAPPRGYTFATLGADVPKAVRTRAKSVPEYRAAVAVCAAELRALTADFRPHLTHVAGLTFSANVCIAARMHPLVVATFGYLEHLHYHPDGTPNPQGAWRAEDHRWLDATSALLAELPALVARCRELAPPHLQVYEQCTGLDGRIFAPACSLAFRGRGLKKRCRWRKV